MSEKNLKIIQLTAENIKRLQAVTITPEGNLEVIGGDNAQGKTSLLDSIEMALNGGKSIPPNPIRKGQKKARDVVDLGELKVERRFTNKGSVLEVKSNGVIQSSPQRILDELIGKLTFDPLAFVNMKPADQLQTLKDLVGVDFNDLDTKRQSLYSERAEVNRDVKQLEGQLEGIPEHEDLPDAPIVVSDLVDELGTIEQHNRDAIEQASTVESYNAEISSIDKELERLRVRAIEIKAEKERLITKRDAITPSQLIDTADLKDKIASAETINQKLRDAEERVRVQKALTAKHGESTKLTLAIEGIDNEKESRLSKVKFPIAGLSFGENGVLMNGLPLEQASSAEALKVSVAMGFALSPRLKVSLIRDGSLLDDSSLRTVAEIAKEHDGQVWIERVSKGSECSVIIEDGMVAETENF